jgi:hypothetical protein
MARAQKDSGSFRDVACYFIDCPTGYGLSTLCNVRWATRIVTPVKAPTCQLHRPPWRPAMNHAASRHHLFHTVDTLLIKRRHINYRCYITRHKRYRPAKCQNVSLSARHTTVYVSSRYFNNVDPYTKVRLDILHCLWHI